VVRIGDGDHEMIDTQQHAGSVTGHGPQLMVPGEVYPPGVD
jgi:hypothetical protein